MDSPSGCFPIGTKTFQVFGWHKNRRFLAPPKFPISCAAGSFASARLHFGKTGLLIKISLYNYGYKVFIRRFSIRIHD
ncbi:hypothetical protein D4Q76_01790 [archaeon]|nr:MAG: hypothetical protein D4Q76_01790 [archaeon]